tara:strand:+ start:84 stop:404 length:321 start_codon:yes stop_codon:yes gene_type:complete
MILLKLFFRCFLKPLIFTNLILVNYKYIQCTIFNIGDGKPIYFIDFINNLEKILKEKNEKIFLQIPVVCFYKFTNIHYLQNRIYYELSINLEESLDKLFSWDKIYF